jgi:hypothetical protein
MKTLAYRTTSRIYCHSSALEYEPELITGYAKKKINLRTGYKRTVKHQISVSNNRLKNLTL